MYKVLLGDVGGGGGGGRGGWEGGGSEFQNPLFRVVRRKPCPDDRSVFYFGICPFLYHCHSFKPSLCHLLPLFYIRQSVQESSMNQCWPAVVPQDLICGVAGDSMFVSRCWAVFTDFNPILPIPLGMVSTVCGKYFSFH